MKHLATVTLMYDDTGSLQWAAAWNDTADGGDTAKAIIADGSGNVIVTGAAWNGSSFDYRTISYDYSANLQWELGYNSKFNLLDSPSDIAVCTDGGIVVAGQAARADDSWSYATVKYRYRDFVIPADSDSVSTSLRWIANNDQLINTDGGPVERVRYYSNQCYPNIYMMDDSLSYVFFQGVDTTDDDTLARIDMTFEGSNAEKRMLPMDKAEYWNNYYLGHIPDGRPFVPLYTRAVMQDVWPNIDVVYSSNQRGLKYYLVINPGGEWGAINLKYHGAESLFVDGNDALVIESEIGELVQPQPLAYTMDGNGELTLLGWQPEYDVSGDEVTLMGVGAYSGTLVFEVNWGYGTESIAAALPEWGTPYGDSGNDAALDIDTDSIGNLYVTGETQSANFPVSGTYSGNFSGYADAFVGRFLNSYLRSWMSFYGSDGVDFGQGVAAEDQASDLVYMCGHTLGWNNNSLPILGQSNSFILGPNGSNINGFIAGFNLGNGFMNWSTYFGANGGECKDVAVDPDGNLYVVGATSQSGIANTCISSAVGTNFPICDPTGFSQPTNHGGMDGFIAKFNTQMQLVWSTLFGGDGVDELWAVAIDNYDHRLYVGGKTISDDIDDYDYLVSCPSVAGSGLTLCQETSVGFFQTELNGGGNSFSPDGLIAKFSLDGSLLWSTLFGGSGAEEIHGLGTRPVLLGQSLQNPRADIWTTGLTSTSIYINTNCVEPNSGDDGFPHCIRWPQLGQFDQDYCNQCSGLGGDLGGNEAFVARFSRQGKIEWSTYLGGGRDDGWMGQRSGSPKISVTPDGKQFVVGATFSGSAGSTPISILASPSSSLFDQNLHSNQGTLAGTDGFVMGFDGNGQQIYGSYYGGSDLDGIWGVSTYADRVFIAGDSWDAQNDLPATPSVQYYMVPNSTSATKDAFFAQIQMATIPVGDAPESVVVNNVSIFPNPSTDEIATHWVSQSGGHTRISIVNHLGHEILSKEFTSQAGENEQWFSLRAMPIGVYLLTIASSGFVESRKIVKQ